MQHPRRAPHAGLPCAGATLGRMVQRPKRLLHVNPDSDTDFVACVDRVGVRAMSPLHLQRHLRLIYPSAVVHRRELSGELVEIWYVYRDGSWTDPRPERVN